MNSDEFSHLIGNNYGNALHPAPVDNFALVMEEANSLNTNDVMHPEPLSPNTLQRIREQNNLIVNDGSERQDNGPIAGISASSQGSHKGGSPGEIKSTPANVVVTYPARGNSQTNIANSTASS